MDSRLDGKVVLVTGSARGIGAAILRAMAAAGADVVLHYTSDPERAEAMAAEVGAGRCRALRADLMDDAQVLGLWADAVAWKGHVDVLVNNAGIYEGAGVGGDFEHWHEAWRRSLQINLVAPGHLCREAIGHFRERGGGIIINIASHAAFGGGDGDHIQYAASKGGMVTMNKTIARAFAPENILSYVLAPGFVNTEGNADYLASHGAAITRGIPLGEAVPPEEIASLAVFLAEGRARHATGTSIDVNGASYVR